MTTVRVTRGAAVVSSMVLALSGCARPPRTPPPSGSSDRGSPYLFVWTTDADSVDLNFLTVLDAREDAATYGAVVTTLAIPTTGRTRGHHTEHRMPDGGRLFANDFGTGKTYVLDVRDPRRPALADSFTVAGELASPHSFERLPERPRAGDVPEPRPGNREGRRHRGARRPRPPGARGERGGGRPLRPSVQPRRRARARPRRDGQRGHARRRGQPGRPGVAPLGPRAPAHAAHPADWGDAAEPRVLADGRTVLVTTFGCALLRLTALDTDTPRVERVYRFPGASCALPAVSGHFWIQTVPAEHALVALDVRQPEAPREVGRVSLGPGHWPHWISLEPGDRRLVVTGYQGTRHRVIVVTVRPGDGRARGGRPVRRGPGWRRGVVRASGMAARRDRRGRPARCGVLEANCRRTP
jgi:hypothetical protein